jgi:hypothetical protein
MSTKSQKKQLSQLDKPDGPSGYLAQEFERWQSLFEVQPVLVQRFLEMQARTLAEALLQPVSQVQFRLPDRVVVSADDTTETPSRWRVDLWIA